MGNLNSRPKQGGKPRRSADPGAFWRTLAAHQPFEAGARVDLSLQGHLAYDAIRQGKGTDDDAEMLAALTNITLVRAEAIDEQAQQVAKDAGAALLRCHARCQELGVWGFDGLGLKAVSEMLGLYDELLKHSTPKQMMDAMVEVQRRKRAGETRSQPVGTA